MIQDKTVTVITTVLNGGPYIEAAIQSMARQSLAPLEHIVVDGGSNDGTQDIVHRLGLSRLIEQKSTPHEAINIALQEARGAYVVFLNADDIFLPGFLERGAQAMQAQRLHAVSGPAEFAVNRPDGSAEILFTRWRQDMDLMLPELALGVPCFNAWMVRTDVMRELGGIDVAFHVSGDREFLMRAYARGPFGVLAEPVYRYLMHDRSMTLSARKPNLRRIALEHLDMIEKFRKDPVMLETLGHILPDWEALEHARLIAMDVRNKGLGDGIKRLLGQSLKHPLWPLGAARAWRLSRVASRHYKR